MELHMPTRARRPAVFDRLTNAGARLQTCLCRLSRIRIAQAGEGLPGVGQSDNHKR